MNRKAVGEVLEHLGLLLKILPEGAPIPVSIETVSLQTNCPTSPAEGNLIDVTYRHVGSAGMGGININQPPWDVRWEDIEIITIPSAAEVLQLMAESENPITASRKQEQASPAGTVHELHDPQGGGKKKRTLSQIDGDD